MKQKILSVMLAILAMAGASILTASAETKTVLSINDSGSGSLRQAVADAADGDEIDFSCTLDGKTITLESAIVINKSITIKGSGQKFAPLKAGYPAIHIPDLTSDGAPNPVTSISRIWFDGFYNTGGAGRDWGGAISSGKTGTIKLYSCIFSNNKAKGAGQAVNKVWAPNGPTFTERFFVYGCTFYNNGNEHTIFLHEEPPIAIGNIFLVNNEKKAFDAPNDAATDDLLYNVYNTTLIDGDIGTTNVKITDSPFDELFIPTTNDIKILPTQLPNGYPTVDFYGNTITAGGYAGAVQQGAPASTCAAKPVTGVSLNQTYLTLELGLDPVRLVATLDPLDATDPTVTWTSNNEAIATVNEEGFVTAVALGQTTVTVTTNDGSLTASTTINVIEPDPCRFRYDRTDWTATYTSGGDGAYGRPNSPTCLFDDNYGEDGIGWHNAGTSGEKKFSEAIVIDMKEIKDVGKIVCYSTDMSDIVVYLSSADEAPQPLHDSDDLGINNPYPIGYWDCPNDDAEREKFFGLYGTGEGSAGCLRVEIDVDGGGRSGRYIIIAYLNTREGIKHTGTYRNMSEVEVFQPCQAISYYIGKENKENVVATLESGVLFVLGSGEMKDFPELDTLGYKGSSAQWIADIKYDEDGKIKTVTKNPISARITDIIIEEGVTNIGANFALDIDGTALPTFKTLIIGESVTSIDSSAFKGVQLENIYIAAEVPPVFDAAAKEAFSANTYENATLHVPAGTKAAYEAAPVWKDFKNIEEETEEIPIVTLPYTPGERKFADDILSSLNSSYPDKNNDGVAAFKFTITEGGKLTAECPAYTLYLFDNEELVSDNQIAKAEGSIANKQLEPGTYYLAIDDDFAKIPEPTTLQYTLSITFAPDGVATANRTVKSVTLYDLLGRQLRSNATGIVIKRITYDDGSIETKKEYRQD
jgi:uncharacterized protein YjdB